MIQLTKQETDLIISSLRKHQTDNEVDDIVTLSLIQVLVDYANTNYGKLIVISSFERSAL